MKYLTLVSLFVVALFATATRADDGDKAPEFEFDDLEWNGFGDGSYSDYSDWTSGEF